MCRSLQCLALGDAHGLNFHVPLILHRTVRTKLAVQPRKFTVYEQRDLPTLGIQSYYNHTNTVFE